MSTLKIKTCPIFEPLLEPARYKGAHGGRGSGKSHFFAAECVKKCIQQPGFRIVCVREVQRSLKESVKRLIEDKIVDLKVDHYFRILNDRIEAKDGGIMLFQGMQDHTAESVKSLEGFDVAYCEEAQTMSERSMEFLRPTIRKEGSELWFSWNPRHASDPVDRLLRGEEVPPNAIVVEANWEDNKFFPDVLEEERLFDRRTNPVRYAHIWEGDYEPMAVGAIWNRANLNENRRKEPPELTRIVIGVDPAISSETGADETGIIVVGLGEDGRGYVLDDVSITAPPLKWATRVVAAYDRYDADAVVIEINQGGEMVASTLRTVRPMLKIHEVRATRGKHVRAEPISSLYDMGRISHVGGFPELENQMVLMTAAGYEGEGSPDRVDALVWAFTELFPRMTRKTDFLATAPKQANNRYDPFNRGRMIA